MLMAPVAWWWDWWQVMSPFFPVPLIIYTFAEVLTTVILLKVII